MVAPRLVGTFLAALALSVPVAAASADDATPAPPTGVHGFLLRADEKPTTAFPRTPAFAWNPVAGAAGYEFQLSISASFRDNGIIVSCPSGACPSVETPVAAPQVDLPWISGQPHALYARARAVMPDGTKTGWSAAFGFDIMPPAPPKPLPSRPGLLRWTPVPGATGYQVWLIDTKKKPETVYTNVLDERDFYTFHSAPSWIGTVRWRIRALRRDLEPGNRTNGVPATAYGAWSPIYQSTNPNPTSGPITLGSTISDVVSNGGNSDPAHRLMPGFTWSGDTTLDGASAELFRVEVFTDRQCINRVFTGPVVGSPAYAPRPLGELALPTDDNGLLAARTRYLGDAPPGSAEPTSLSYDGESITSTESMQAATPQTTVPATDAAPAAGNAGATPAATAITAPSAAQLGAPVSLWDDSWPASGYYWTVVGVAASSPDTSSTTLVASAPVGATVIFVADPSVLSVGETVMVGSGSSVEPLRIKQIAGNMVTLAAATLLAHTTGDSIGPVGTLVYQDLELPQDVCAAGRVARFGINSEPTLLAGDDAFASGVSPDGSLTSALQTTSFYKAPVVSWTPALGAGVYEIEWSKTGSPFQAVGSAMTPTTSYVLNGLEAGTWYYRVRGFDWSLPTNAQEMGWSDPTRIVIANPSFKVVSSTRTKSKVVRPKPKKK